MIIWLAVMFCIWLTILHRRTLDSGRLAGLLAVALRAGSTSRDALSHVADCIENPLLRGRLRLASHLLTQGSTLSDALAESKVPMPHSFLVSLRLAEQVGGAAGFLEASAEQFQQRAATRGRQLMLSVYPLLVLLVLVETAIFTVVYILPTFVSLFEGMNLTLPLPTKLLIFVTKTVTSPLFSLGVAAMVLAMVALVVVARRQRSLVLARMVGILPFFGTLQMLAACEESAAILGSLLSGGLDLPRALEATGAVVDNPLFGQAFTTAAHDVARGESLSASLARQRVVPRLVTWTCALGERTEALGDVLLDLSGYYRDKAARMTGQGLRLWQPLLVYCLGMLAGFFVLSVFLPIYQMIGCIG